MCQSKYLNNLIVQDYHRAVKRITRPKLGFKTFRCARILLAGIEVMHMIRKGQLGAIKDLACVCSEPVLLARFLIGVGLAAMLGLFLLLRQNLLIRPFEVINILAGRSRELHCESSKFKGPEQ